LWTNNFAFYKSNTFFGPKFHLFHEGSLQIHPGLPFLEPCCPFL